jgi:hypothetical protein
MTPWGARVCTLVGMLALAGSVSAAPQKPLIKPPPGREAPAPTPAPGERPADTPAPAPAVTPESPPPPVKVPAVPAVPAAPTAPAPTAPDAELALARTRVVELHVARIGQVLDECRLEGTLDGARAAALRAALPAALDRDVVASWHRPSPAELGFEVDGGFVVMEDGGVARVNGVIDIEGNVEEPVDDEARDVIVGAVAVGMRNGGDGVRDIAHSTLREWLSSEAWPALLAAHVTEDEAIAVQQALAARSTAVLQAEAAFLEARLARGLCLTDEERLALRGPLEEFVRSRPHDVVATHRLNDSSSGDEVKLLKSLAKQRVTEALPAARREALSCLQEGTRGPEDDLAVEIEHLVAVHQKGDRERELLRGFAQTLVERSVVRKKALPGRGILAPVSDLDKVDLWSKGLRGVLDLPDDTEFESLPSRLLTPVRVARAEFLLAVVDELACLGDEQRAAARVMLLELALLEANDKRSEAFNVAVAPRALGLRCDGRLELQRAQDDDSLSAEERAVVTRLHALLTPAQREVALR